MTETTDFHLNGIEQVPIYDFAEKAYLEYSMYVVLDRALPHIGDGLKPVQRRIVYAMSELGLRSTAKHKKSARTVGDVLGKFHPHGDSACYSAMVLMAQPFSFRYPLVDGQGNWGSPDDPKSFAAMRYTESKLTEYANVMLNELGQGTVDWKQNFDGTLKEPTVLPARLPNILLNGTTGIAVGMATDIPPHNLLEITNACVLLLKKPTASFEEIRQWVKGPDFPTEAEIITPGEEIDKIYRSGTGTIRMRAVYQKEQGDIVITALPHQVSGTKVMEQIAAQMRAKKLPMVEDLRDESDHESPTRFVIVPRSNRVNADQLMAHLFATTDLERTYRINMNVIALNGKPRVMNLEELLKQWVSFRLETVRRRLSFRLEKVLDRLHLLEGLLIAFINLDEIISVIRNEDKPKPHLMERFGLSDRQTEAILETKLRHLAKLEELKIKGEQDELAAEQMRLEKTLNSETRLRTLLRKEMELLAEKYGDERRSPLVSRQESHALTDADLLPVEQITVLLSNKGWVRAAKGHDINVEKLSFKTGDALKDFAHGRSNQQAVFLGSTGRSYSLPASNLPSARGHGEPLSGRLTPPPGAVFEAALLGEPDSDILLASSVGYGFITKLSELYTKNRAGKSVLNLPQGATPLPPLTVHSLKTDLLVSISNEGRLLIFPVSHLPILPRGKGNKIISVFPKKEETLKHLFLLPHNTDLIIIAGKRRMTLQADSLDQYRGERGRRGQKLPQGFRRVDGLESGESETNSVEDHQSSIFEL